MMALRGIGNAAYQNLGQNLGPVGKPLKHCSMTLAAPSLCWSVFWGLEALCSTVHAAVGGALAISGFLNTPLEHTPATCIKGTFTKHDSSNKNIHLKYTKAMIIMHMHMLGVH